MKLNSLIRLAWLKPCISRASTLAAACSLMLTQVARAGSFTAGNLVVLQADASVNNTTCTIVELSPSSAGQTPSNTIGIDGTGSNALRISGSAGTTGYLATSDDKSLLSFIGANNVNTSANANTLNPRGVGTLNAAGVFGLPATYTGTSGNQARGATSVDNANWFIADQGGLYTNNASVASPALNLSCVKSFAGTVYASQAKLTTFSPVVSVTAATGGATVSLPGLPNNASTSSPNVDFYFVSSGSNGAAFDVLYILNSTSATAGSIDKFSLVSGSWTANGSYVTAFGGFGIAAEKSGGGAALYVTSGNGSTPANNVIKLSDAAGYNAAINITTGNNVTLYTTPAGTIAKGIAFAPVVPVLAAPVIVTHPQSQSVVNGGTATLTVAASGTPVPTYQWYQGASPSTTNLVVGATSSSYTTPAISTATSYWARATNSQGTADSNSASISVTFNTNLSSLALSAGTLSPVFAAGTTSYATSVSNATASLNVTPSVADSTSTVQVRVSGGIYTTVTSGNASGSLLLSEGVNTVDVKVTGQDGVATKTYSVTVVRAPSVVSSTTRDILDPNTGTWSASGVTIGGTQFVNLGLQGVGRLAASTLDPVTGESLGSISDMQVTNFVNNNNGTWSGTFNFLPDRGYNSGAIYSNYAARINAFNFTFTPYTGAATTADQNQIAMTFAGSTRFTYDNDGNANTPPVFTTGLNADGTASLFGTTVPVASGNTTQSDGTVANRLTLDSEALVLDRRPGKNGSGWVGDEYGGYIYHFNSAKQIDGQLQLPAAIVPHTPAGTVNFNGTPTNGRRDNQGMEGVTQTPDGRKLFGLTQSATIQDSGSGNQGRSNARLLVYDISSSDTPSDPVAQYVLQLPRIDTTGSASNGTTVDRTGAQSSILALNDHQFLVLSRDGNGRGASGAPVFKSILLADLNGATNIDGLYDAEGAAVAPAGVLAVGVTPINWTEALNMIGKLDLGVAEVAKFGLNLSAAPGDINTICEKWEAMGLVSANDPANPNDYFLFVGNDNDFLTSNGKYLDASNTIQSYNSGLENDTLVLAYRVRLSGPENQAPFVASAIPNQPVNIGTALSYSFPANTFVDANNGQTLTYTATKADDTALPAWLSFNAATRTFSGTPGAGDVGTLVVKVTATDNGSPALWGSATFSIVVSYVPPTFSFASATTSVREDANKVTLTVKRTGDLAAATINVSTTDGTAIAGTDYTTLSIFPVAFAAADTSKTVDIVVKNRAGIRANRTFTATLASPGAPVVTGTPATVTVTITEADSFATNTGPSSSTTPYLQPLTGSYQTTSILSVGDAVPLTGTTSGQTFQMVGIPDGLGAFDNGDGTMTVLMNHELGNTLGGVRTHGAIGSFVSEWIINKSTLQVVSGSDLIRNVYGWNATTQTSDSTTSSIAFNRFCSADLPPVSAFYNAATGLGTQERIFMNGDESGSNGYAMAHVATGTNKGSSYILGKFNLSTNGSGLTGVGGWENVLANPYAQDKTVVVGNNDGGTGIMTNAVAVYVGTKTSVGTEADKAGLTNGTIKFINVTGNPVEITNTTSRTTGITSGTAFTLSDTTSTTFSRPEDGAWDPSNLSRFYFVTTDRLDQVADGLGSQIGRTRLWRLNFTDITNPDLGGTIDLLVEGGVGNDANMWDNLTVTPDGKLMIEEDVGGAAHNGKIWSYDPVSGTLTKVLKHDIARFGSVAAGVTTAATSPFTNDEEGSGIIDVTNLFGGNATIGDRYFLTSDQAHYPLASPLVEGGQLVLIHQLATTAGISSSATPYLLPVDSSWKTSAILSVGDAVPLTGTTSGQTFQMVGIPDGLGAFDNGDGTMTVLMNHELGNTLGGVRSHGAIGSFVSEWIINKSTLQVVSGSDLIRNVYGWNATTQTSDSATSTIAFNRFCSADLPPVSAFYNAATGLGTQERIFMNGDESGSNGYAMAHVATGSNKGSSYVLGKFNLTTNGSGLTGVGGWENVLANPYAQDKTVVVGNNDGGTGIMTNAVAVYVGTKTSVGTEADKAGLTNGTIKFVNVTGNPVEITNTTTRTTGITSGTAFTLSDTTSTTFSRPEDGAWDPSNLSRFYFVTTDRLDQVADGLGSQIGRTRLWRLNFTDITNPDLGGTIDLLVEGGVGNDANMWDNLTVTPDGKLMIEEDVGGAAHNGKIWSYDPVSGTLTKALQHDPARFGEVVGGVTAAATLPFTNDEEGSGIIDVTAIMGGNVAAGERLFLTSDQAHYPLASPLVEGGQLLLLRQSPKVAFSLAAATSTVNEDAGSVTLTVNRYGDLQYPAAVNLSTTGGSAVAGTDFTALNNVAVNFAPGENTKTVEVAIVNRSGFQGNRNFTASLHDAASGAVLGSPSSTTLTIAELITTSVINLADATVNVNQGANTATIHLVRSVGSSPVTIDLHTTDGSAIANADYTTPSGANATVSFEANSNTASKTITLIPNGAAQNRSFTVTLTNPGPNASVGNTSPTTTTVRILASDSTAPTVAISSPTEKQVVNYAPDANDKVTVQGTSNDNLGVDKVQVRLNGVYYGDATLTPSGTGASWKIDVLHPPGGANTVSVTAVDARGNTSPAATRNFSYKKLSALTVNVAGTGTISGKLNGVAYEVGKSYTLTAVPGATQTFNGWTGVGFTAPSNEVAKFTFVFTDALFASPVITANFIAKTFTTSEIGAFNGLVTPLAGTASSNSTNGFMNLTLTTAGSFSGLLKIDGFSLTVSGLFNNAGEARFGPTRASTVLVNRTGKPALELSQVHWDSVANTITGVIKQYQRTTVTAQSGFVLDRAAFSAAIPVSPAAYTVAGGKYTVILPAKAQDNGLTSADFPQGTGIGLITITPAGVVSLSGTLADSTVITASVPLSSALNAPLFAQLYATKGSFGGLVHLDNTQGDSDLKAVKTIWYRPFQNNVQHYPFGWDEGVTLELLGAKYAPVAGTSVIPGLLAPSGTGNATLLFSDGLLSAPVGYDFNISTTNAVLKIPTTNAAYTLTLTANAGDISGTFTHTNGTKPTFKGKVFTKGVQGGAHGFFMTVKPKAIDGLGESGKVDLNHK